MSKMDAIKSYQDYLVGKGSFILRAPSDAGREPSARDYDLDDELERELYASDKALHKSRVEQSKEKDALQVLAYVITDLMGLTPEEALIQFEIPGRAKEYIEAWKLDKVLDHIHMPPGIRRTNYRYLFSLIFPGRITYDEDELTLEVYRRVLEGEIPRLPRNFLKRKGSIKLCVMLMQYISTHIRAIQRRIFIGCSAILRKVTRSCRKQSCIRPAGSSSGHRWNLSIRCSSIPNRRIHSCITSTVLRLLLKGRKGRS